RSWRPRAPAQGSPRGRRPSEFQWVRAAVPWRARPTTPSQCYLITASWKRLQFWFIAIGQRIAVDIQHHRNEAVVAHHTCEIDSAALAKLVDNSLEGSVAHISVLEQFVPEV